MSLVRLWAVCSLDLRHALKRPLYWIWAVIIFFCAFGLSSGAMQIQAGDSATGGVRAHITSALANGMEITLLGGIFYSFFLAVAAGLELIRDRETRIEAMLHSTPLTLGEYVWGKFGAALIGAFCMLGLQVVLAIFFKHAVAVQESSELIGEFRLLNYLQPALLFALPMIVFIGGLSFFIGEVTRRPVLVNMLPLAILFLCMFLLWSWTPPSLDPRINQALMCVDPTGFRWLQQTWIEVDRGAEFYNSSLIPFEWPFYLSRLVMIALGLGAVWFSQRHLARSLCGTRVKPQVAQAALLAGRADTSHEHSSAPRRRPLADLNMSSRRPSFLAAMFEVARLELRILIKHPGVWLFLPLLVINSTFGALYSVGPFDTRLLLTPGRSAVSSLDELTFTLCLLLMFYTVESLRREETTRLESIAYSTPTSTYALILGKLLATSSIGVLVLGVEIATFAVMLLVQGTVPLDVEPYLLIYGLAFLPVVFFWNALIATIYSIWRNRFVTYSVGLGVLIWAGVSLALGNMSWVWNWSLVNALVWTDLGPLEMDREPLAYNRVLVITSALFLMVLAARIFPRRKFDSTRVLLRLQPLSLAKTALHLGPWLIIPVFVGIDLQCGINRGPGSEQAKGEVKAYWTKNMRTWLDSEDPDIAYADVAIELDPPRRWIRSEGYFDLVNPHDEPLLRIAMTQGLHWEDIQWTLNDQSFEADDREGLHVFELSQPLLPGQRCKIGWEFEGVLHDGYSKNGGRASEFILESGVVLTSFTPTFVPLVGYQEGRGIDEDNSYDSREYPDDFFEGMTHAAFGPDVPHPTRISITAPERYTMNSVGVLLEDSTSNGQRTVVWGSDEPVRFFNVIGGKWAVARGEGTALYYHPEHDYNVEQMLSALEGAREHYSKWFHPFPWDELRVSEFAAYAGYAQGFPSNISFSESIGFLTKEDDGLSAAYFVTAHEAAHQWWGNILMPGEGPGGNLLAEGTANFSCILLFEEAKGLEQRIEFCKNLEDSYNTGRVVDSERELVKIDGSKSGDTTVTYDKMAWVVWMMLNEVGRENMLVGLREFFDVYTQSRDHPLLQDFVLHIREHASDQQAFDEFVEQWFFEVVLPEYEFEDVELERVDDTGDAHVAKFTLHNAGTSRMRVEVAATRGERFPSEESEEDAEAYLEARIEVMLEADEYQALELPCNFEPEQLIVDPDALILQRGRAHALHRF